MKNPCMSRLMLVLCMMFLLPLVCPGVFDQATAQSPTEWYTMNSLGRECQKLDGTPADKVETFSKVKALYTVTMDDVVEKSTVVQTTMTLSETMTGLTLKTTFYRGKARCEEALAKQNEAEERERRTLDKYR